MAEEKKLGLEEIRAEADQIVAEYAAERGMAITSVVDFGDDGPILDGPIADSIEKAAADFLGETSTERRGPARYATRAYRANYDKIFGGSHKKRDPKLN